MAVGALDFIGDLAMHQAVIIKNAHARGALAFLLVELDAAGVAPQYYAVDWAVLGPWWRGYQGRHYGKNNPASIPAVVLAAEAVPVRRVRKTLDLLGAIATLAARVPVAGNGA